jgi:anti-anti-sigma regulatory factor
MKFKVNYQDNFLILKISGTVGLNERLLSKKSLLSSLQTSYQKVIVDLSDPKKGETVYCPGVLNSLKKEIQLMRAELKICSLKPEVSRYFRENRSDQIFDIKTSIEASKRSFLEKNND